MVRAHLRVIMAIRAECRVKVESDEGRPYSYFKGAGISFFALILAKTTHCARYYGLSARQVVRGVVSSRGAIAHR